MYEEDDMTPEDIAAHFGEEIDVPKEQQFLEEDIYSINARIKNMAVYATGNNLTPVGIQLANAYTHVILEFYKFAVTLPVADCERLKTLVRSKEEFVAKFVAAVPPPPGVKSGNNIALDPKGDGKL